MRTLTNIACTSGFILLLMGCVPQRLSEARILYLRLQQFPALPSLCTKLPQGSSSRLLLLFASPWCSHCHALMNKMRKDPKWLTKWKITPVVLWTDTKNCLKARMAGAHYPAQWPFGYLTVREQQEWGVRATPVLYLLRQGRPILRIDGATTLQQIKRSIQTALLLAHQSSHGGQALDKRLQ